MRVVNGLDAIEAASSPAFVVVGVFDGLHRGHAYLLEHLVDRGRSPRRPARRDHLRPPSRRGAHRAAPRRSCATPTSGSSGSRRPASIRPSIVHFDRALRETPYDAFVGRLAARTPIDGFLMTPDAAFGYQRAGTPEALAELGAARGFEVVVVPAFEIDGRPVSSSRIRSAIAAGRPRVGREPARTAARGRRRGNGGGRGERAPVPAPRRPAPASQIPGRHRSGFIGCRCRDARPTSRTRSSASRLTAWRVGPGWRSSTSR